MFDHAPKCRKGNANGNVDFISRLPQPATEHDRRGSSRLTPVDDEAINLVKAFGLLTPYTSIPGIMVGRLVPQPDSAVLGGLPLTFTDLRDISAHGSSMRIDVLSTPTGRFVARVSAFVAVGNDGLGRSPFWPAADATFTPVSGVFRDYSARRTPADPYAAIGDFSGTAAYGPQLHSDTLKTSRCGRCCAACSGL